MAEKLLCGCLIGKTRRKYRLISLVTNYTDGPPLIRPVAEPEMLPKNPRRGCQPFRLGTLTHNARGPTCLKPCQHKPRTRASKLGPTHGAIATVRGLTSSIKEPTKCTIRELAFSYKVTYLRLPSLPYSCPTTRLTPTRCRILMSADIRAILKLPKYRDESRVGQHGPPEH